MKRKDGPYNFWLVREQSSFHDTRYKIWLTKPDLDSKSKRPPAMQIGSVVLLLDDVNGLDNKWASDSEFFEQFGQSVDGSDRSAVAVEMIKVFLDANPDLKEQYTHKRKAAGSLDDELAKLTGEIRFRLVVMADALADKMASEFRSRLRSCVLEFCSKLTPTCKKMLEDQREKTKVEDVVPAIPAKNEIVSQSDGEWGDLAVGGAQEEYKMSGEESTFDKYIWPGCSSLEFVRKARKRYKEGFLSSEAKALRNRIMSSPDHDHLSNFINKADTEEDGSDFFAYVIAESRDDEIQSMLLAYRINLEVKSYTQFKPVVAKWRIIIDRLGWKVADLFRIQPDLGGSYYTLDELKEEIRKIKSKVVELSSRWDAPYIADLLIRFQSERRPFKYEHVIRATEELAKETYAVVLEA